MALQSSGAISLNNIQTEFGGSNPIGISEYTKVPNGLVPATTTNAAVDAGPTVEGTTPGVGGSVMSFSDYYGTAKDITVSSANITPSSLAEGATFTLTVNTANAANGTILYWTMVGTGTYPASGGDVTVSTGTITINSNTGSTTIGTSDNLETTASPNVQFYVQIRKDSLSGTVLSNSNTVTITEVWDSVALLGHSVFTDTIGTGGTATSTFSLLAAGTATGNTQISGTTFATRVIDGTNTTSTVTFPGQWWVSGQDKTQYSARGTWSGTGGTLGGPADGAWVALTANRNWQLSTTGTNVSRNLTVEIAPTVDTSTILASSIVQFKANSSLYTASVTSTTPLSVAEAGSFNVVVNTSAIPNGTTLYWTLLGTGTNPADAADLTAGGSGSFTTTNASTTLAFTTAQNADGAAITSQTLQIEIRAGGTSGPVIATSSTVTINEPSVYNFSVTVGWWNSNTFRGYASGQGGSISGNFGTSAGTITALYTQFVANPLGGGTYFTQVSGLNASWTSLTIGSQTFTRASATSGTTYSWISNTNLYTTAGAVIACALTI